MEKSRRSSDHALMSLSTPPHRPANSDFSKVTDTFIGSSNDELAALPPPSLPLATSRYLDLNSDNPADDIPFHQWVRLQQRKFVRLNKRRAAHLVEIPAVDAKIPFKLLSKPDSIKKSVLSMLHSMAPEWRVVHDVSQLQLERLKGAMTNAMFICQACDVGDEEVAPKKLLLRVYGQGADQFFDRAREIFILQVLSCMKVGPRLVGMFSNGRFEEYIDSTSLFHQDLVEPVVSCKIADKLFGIHSLVGIIPSLEVKTMDDGEEYLDTTDGLFKAEYEPELWDRIDNWLKKSKLAVAKMLSQSRSSSDSDGSAGESLLTVPTSEQLEQIRELNFDHIEAHISLLRRQVEILESPVVFTHNDLQYGNILQRVPSKDIMLIDFEYACYNYRGFDIANHFCEWAADYHTDTPHVMHFDRMPNQEQQLRFFNSYLDARDAFIQTRYNYRRSSFSSIGGMTKEQVQHVSSLNPMPSQSAANTPIHPLISPRLGPRYPLKLTGKSPSLSPEPSPSLSPMLTPQVLQALRKQELDHLLEEVEVFTPLSHIMWGLWGLIQAEQSAISFDFTGYALQRLNEAQCIVSTLQNEA
eukprot:Partr_v1_DN28550_c1_g1_i10_m73565 putative choline kinase